MANLDKDTAQPETITAVDDKNINKKDAATSIDPKIVASSTTYTYSNNNNSIITTNQHIQDHKANQKTMGKLFPEALVPEATKIYEQLKLIDPSYDLDNPKHTELLQTIKEDDIKAFADSLRDVDSTIPTARQSGLQKNVNTFRQNLDNRIYFKIINPNSPETQKIAILLRILREWKRVVKKQILSQLKHELAKAKERADAAKDELKSSREVLAQEEKKLSNITAEITSHESKLKDKKTVDNLKKLRGSIKGLEGQLRKSTDENSQKQLRESIKANEEKIEAQEQENNSLVSKVAALKEEKQRFLASSTEKVELNKKLYENKANEIQSLIAKIALTRIQNKFLPAEIVSTIKEICPGVLDKFDNDKHSITICDKENKPLIKIKTTADNHKRFVSSENNNNPTLVKKVGIHYKNEVINVNISNLNINLDEYVYDANGVATPRYIVRSITPQERAALAEYSLNAGLLPLDHHAKEITPLEKATYENNVKKGSLNNESLKDNLVVSAILHRTGTRRLICASFYEPKESSTKFISNSDKAFFSGDDNFDTYMPNTRTSTKYNEVVYLDTIKVNGGGMILIDLAKIPQEFIFTQGKRDSTNKIVGIEKNGRAARSYGEFEQTFAMISAYRNKEIHLAEISPGSIMAWLPAAEAEWQTTVTPAQYYENGDTSNKKPLTIDAINEIERKVEPSFIFDAYIKPVDKNDLDDNNNDVSSVDGKFTLFAAEKGALFAAEEGTESVVAPPVNNIFISDNNSEKSAANIATNRNTLFAQKDISSAEKADNKLEQASIPIPTQSK